MDPIACSVCCTEDSTHYGEYCQSFYTRMWSIRLGEIQLLQLAYVFFNFILHFSTLGTPFVGNSTIQRRTNKLACIMQNYVYSIITFCFETSFFLKIMIRAVKMAKAPIMYTYRPSNSICCHEGRCCRGRVLLSHSFVNRFQKRFAFVPRD